MNKPYDLEERTFLFARECRVYIKTLPKTTSNIEDGKQLIRSSGSVGANYIEANEKLGEKDLILDSKYQERKPKNLNIGFDYCTTLIPNIKYFQILYYLR